MTTKDLIASVRKNPVMFGCGALTLCLAAAIYLRSDEIPDTETELAKRATERDRLALNIKYAAQLPEQLASISNSMKEIESRLIRSGQIGANTQFFYKLERDTGVKILEFRQNTTGSAAKAPAPTGAFLPVPFAINIQGTLSQILAFLGQLENGAHYCRVLTASFSGNAAARGPQLTLALNIELLGQP